MNNTERILRRLNQVANLNRDAGRTQTAETCYSAIKIINELNKQNDEAYSEIRRLMAENEVLHKNADEAFQEGLNENRALFVREIREKIENAICENTYPGADKNMKPVLIWRAKSGYDAVKEVIEKEAESKSRFIPFFTITAPNDELAAELREDLMNAKIASVNVDGEGMRMRSLIVPFDIGESVWTVIEDDEDEEKIFASECHVTDVSRKGVWVSGYEPPEDDCSVLIAWEEFGVDAFTRYEDALAEVERRKNGDG